MTVKKLGLKQRYAHMTRGLDWETTLSADGQGVPLRHVRGHQDQGLVGVGRPVPADHGHLLEVPGGEGAQALRGDRRLRPEQRPDQDLRRALRQRAEAVPDRRLAAGVSGASRLRLRRPASARRRPARRLRRCSRSTNCATSRRRSTPSATTTSSSTASPSSRTCTTACGISRVPKSFFDDARTAGPFEFMIAIGFAFEYVLTNLLFVPFMSGAAYNGDLSTVTFGFSAQSDESRHMTLGIEVIKFLLEQHPDNLPIVQKWVDKWFWRGHRGARHRRDDDGLHAAQEGHVLARSLGHLLHRGRRLAVPGSRALRLAGRRNTRSRRRSRPITSRTRTGRSSTSTRHAAAFHTWMPDREHLDWLSREISEHLRQAIIGRAGRCGRRWRRQASASTTWRCRSSARPARSRWRTPSRAIRRRSASATRSSRARPITSARTAAKTSSTTSRRSMSRPGCRCTRSSRAIAAAPTVPDVLD